MMPRRSDLDCNGSILLSKHFARSLRQKDHTAHASSSLAAREGSTVGFTASPEMSDKGQKPTFKHELPSHASAKLLPPSQPNTHHSAAMT